MKRNVNRIDHVAAIVRPENFEATIAKISNALQIAFYGPFEREDLGLRVAVALDAGIELITPLSTDENNPAVVSLNKFGERWVSVVFGVRDVDETCDRLEKLGHAPQIRHSGLTGVEPYLDRLTRLDEARFDADLFGGLPIVFATIEERTDTD
ncbi:MAG: VOC family protein [Rhizomicrobium sp.]